MKYIKELQLINFESWYNNVIKFDKGLNIIIGNSDSGKSGSFRALDSIFSGKFRDSSITFGKKKSEVTIIFDNGNIAKRIRSKKENIIQYDNLVFERVGKEIPNEYFEALGNTKLKLNDDKDIDLCLYSQFMNHFFITSSDIEKSKIIGAACGINIVDKIIDNVNTDIRHNNLDLKHLKSTVDEQQVKLNQLTLDVDIKNKKLNQLTDIIGRINTNYNKLVEIDHLYQNYIILNNINIPNLQNKIFINQNKISKFQLLKSKFQILNLLLKIQKYSLQLSNIKNKINQIQNKISNIQNYKSKFQTLNLLLKIQNQLFNIQNLNNKISINKIKISKFQILNDKISKFQILNDKVKILKNSLLNIENIKQRIQQINEQLQLNINEKDNLHKNTGICPLCGSIIGENK